jgi:acetolactate synthase-1/2/3 large subunit
MIRSIGSIMPEDTIITTDVGQHQMWVAQAYPFSEPRTFLTSGGLGTMGFGLPVAIGAALAAPDRQVICFSGDGSILMNIQELATLADLKLNVKVIIMNNHHLGLVRQQQELFYGENYFASRFSTSLNFSGLAKQFACQVTARHREKCHPLLSSKRFSCQDLPYSMSR